ncbi:phosphotransferase [Brevibacillus daliensis]|uniref:phosphotransferase n=1 Tax=Brevibacillus daliensis TaxID=2892995 RepID=UPI001E3E858A|nr:hypothetical protein [Brevibacillus daliensis]
MSRFDQLYPLFQDYDMYIESIEVIKAPQVHKGITPYGAYVCKQTFAPPDRLTHVGGVLRHLQERGWEGAVPFLYTKFDEPFVKKGEEVYYLTEWVESNSITIDNLSTWATATAVRLAEFHQLTQNYRFDDPRQIEPLVDALLTRWVFWIQQMNLYRDLALEREYPSPFDVVFLANYPFLTDISNQALESLKLWRRRHETSNHFRLCLIHGFPHPSHTIMDDLDHVRLLNFDRTVFDTPVRDMTALLRNYYQLGGDDKGASQVMEQYGEVFPLRPEETALMKCFLHYPERVMRDLESYYQRRYEWTELFAVRRIEKDLDRLMRLQRWVNQKW